MNSLSRQSGFDSQSTRSGIRDRRAAWLTALLVATAANLAAQQWPHYAGDQAASHYSPLEQITAANVARLAIAWEWKPGEKALPQFGTRPGAFQNTPLVIDNVMYLSTPLQPGRGPRCGERQATVAIRSRGPTKTASRPTARASRIAGSSPGATPRLRSGNGKRCAAHLPERALQTDSARRRYRRARIGVRHETAPST